MSKCINQNRITLSKTKPTLGPEETLHFDSCQFVKPELPFLKFILYTTRLWKTEIIVLTELLSHRPFKKNHFLKNLEVCRCT